MKSNRIYISNDLCLKNHLIKEFSFFSCIEWKGKTPFLLSFNLFQFRENLPFFINCFNGFDKEKRWDLYERNKIKSSLNKISFISNILRDNRKCPGKMCLILLFFPWLLIQYMPTSNSFYSLNFFLCTFHFQFLEVNYFRSLCLLRISLNKYF